MKRLLAYLHADDNAGGITARTSLAIQAMPFLLMGGIYFLLIIPPFRAPGYWLLKEGHPVEFLTFVFLCAAGAIAIRSARQFRGDLTSLHQAFYIFFGLAVIFVGLEEVAWGQHLFFFEPPEAIRAINEQEELTLHNLPGLQGHSEWFRLAFGIGGLVGIFLRRFGAFRDISVHTVLLPAFVVITIHAGYDVIDDIERIIVKLSVTMQATAEMLEMIIGIAALLYVWLKSRELGARFRKR